MSFKNLIPLKDAPKVIPYAEKTLRNWRYQGIYPQIFMKLGGKVFVDLDALSNIITEQQKKAKKLALRQDSY
jgi:hypothetical protein